jgi:RNA polymerase sigma-70 factor (ECF subfamily)
VLAQSTTPETCALRAGDPVAFERLFEANADRLDRLAYRLMRDPQAAEDVVQESFLAVVRGIGSFEGRSSLDTWLCRVATITSIDRLRRRTEGPLPPDEAVDEAGVMPQAFVD